MSELMQVMFPLKSVEIRVVKDGDQIWFVGKDVCTGLGLVNSKTALARLDADEKSMQVCGTSKGVSTNDPLSKGGTNYGPPLKNSQTMTCVNESGLYHLIFTSNKPEAEVFRKWVTSEVLPSLRKTGRYEMPEVSVPSVPDLVLLSPLRPTARTMRDPRVDPVNVSAPEGVVDMRSVLMHTTRLSPINVPMTTYYVLHTEWYLLTDFLKAIGQEGCYDQTIRDLLAAGLRPAEFLCYGKEHPEVFVSAYMAAMIDRSTSSRFTSDYILPPVVPLLPR